MNYSVAFEARSRNAQGEFFSQIVFVQANNKDEANRAAMNKLHEANFETRFPISTVENELFQSYKDRGLVNNGLVDMKKLAAQKKKAVEDYISKINSQKKISFYH
jgi:tetrahydrodipicolinate N-succinyltransferase